MGRSDELCSEEIKPSTTSFAASLARIQKQTHEGIKDLSIGTQSRSCGDTEHSRGLALAGGFSSSNKMHTASSLREEEEELITEKSLQETAGGKCA